MSVHPTVSAAARDGQGDHAVRLGNELNDPRAGRTGVDDVDSPPVCSPLNLGEVRKFRNRFLQEIDRSLRNLLCAATNCPKEVLLWKRRAVGLKLWSPSFNFGGLGV
jgi:hypothetical protein